MQVKQLIRLLRDPHKITPKDAKALRDLLPRYPYFQGAYALLAKFSCDQDEPHAGQAVQLAAVYATDRNYLKALLKNILPDPVPTPEDVAVVPALRKKITLQAGAYDFVNDYINTIQQKEKRKITKTKSRAQLDSIQAFLQKNVDFKHYPMKIVR